MATGKVRVQDERKPGDRDRAKTNRLLGKARRDTMKSFLVAAAVFLSAVSLHAADAFLTLTRSGIPLSDAPANTDVITSQEFEKTTARTVGDVVQNEPGILVQKVGSEGSQELAFIRGFQAQQILVVIDDVPQTPDLIGTVDLSRIPLDNVDRIEILRGGASAVYGPNAEGGVIHIITQRPLSALDLRATSEGGSYGTFHNLAEAGTSVGPINAQITSSHDMSDGFQQNSGYHNTNLSGLFSCDAGHFGKLTYNAEGAKGDIGLPSGTPAPIDSWNGTVERQANDLSAMMTETDRNNRVQYSNRVGEIDVTARIANNVKNLGTLQFGSETDIRTEGRNAFGEIEKLGTGALGFELYQRRLDSNVFGTHRGDAWGVFYQAYFIGNNWIKLTPGVRYDHDNSYGESWSPRIQLVVMPADRWKVSASAGRSFQAPTFSDLYNPFVRPQFQPTSLSPETTWSYDVGTTVSPLENLEVALTLFYSDTKNRIAVDPNKDFAAYNLDSAYAEGGETEIKYAYKTVHQKVGYTYLDAEGINGGFVYRTLAFSPKHKIDYRMDVELPANIKTSLTVQYVDHEWTDIGETGVEIPSYTVAGLKASKKFGWIEIFFACDNLFDRHYAEAADAVNGYFPQPGRTYSGGVTMRFLR
jgi:outer membrane receptor protein involved in Fe transport